MTKGGCLAMLLAGVTALPAAGGNQPAGREPLAGLREFSLEVSLDDEAAACGITSDQVEAAVRAALRDSAPALDGTARTRLGARASTTRVAEGVCAYALALEVAPRVTIEATGVSTAGTVWSRQAITCGPVTGAERLTREVFTQATRQLVSDWRRANP